MNENDSRVPLPLRNTQPEADGEQVGAIVGGSTGMIDDRDGKPFAGVRCERRMNESPLPVQVYRKQGAQAVLEGCWVYALQHSPFASLAETALGPVFREKLIAAPALGYWPRVEHPRTFNEHILHRKHYTDDARFERVSDKYTVREYVAEKVGIDVLNDLLYATDDPATIPFAEFPEQFVLKATHGAGFVHIVEDKATADFEAIREECREWLATDFGAPVHEYWYSEIDPRIVVERYIDVENRKAPRDFKCYVFDGHVEYIHVDYGRFSRHTRRFYDREWTPMDFRVKYPLGPTIPEPDGLDEMIAVAERLGEEFAFARVDLFNPDGESVVFGEITLAPGTGQEEFVPVERDFEFGSNWKRPHPKLVT